MKLKRVQSGVYETIDTQYRVFHWAITAGNRKSWAIAEWDGKDYSFVCEVLTLSEARDYLDGKDVFILS